MADLSVAYHFTLESYHLLKDSNKNKLKNECLGVPWDVQGLGHSASTRAAWIQTLVRDLTHKPSGMAKKPKEFLMW